MATSKSQLRDFHEPDITALTRAVFLVGTPIAHSRSPALHRIIYDAAGQPTWAQVLYETNDLASFVAYLRSEPKAFGSGVTMPFKVTVMALLDGLSPEARVMGAVNTITVHHHDDDDAAAASGRRLLVGHNTDCLGVRGALVQNLGPARVAALSGRPALIVGAGGTCRAAVYALGEFLGCAPIYVANRDAAEVEAVARHFGKEKVDHRDRDRDCVRDRDHDRDPLVLHVRTVAEAKTLQPPAVVVSAVPDVAPQTEAEEAVRAVLSHFLAAADDDDKSVLLEMCYHPSPDTAIARLGREAGWRVVGGVEAMIDQGLAQARLWMGLDVTDAMRGAARIGLEAGAGPQPGPGPVSVQSQTVDAAREVAKACVTVDEAPVAPAVPVSVP